MVCLRRFETNDADTILTWVNDKEVFYKWTAGMLGDYPLLKESFLSVCNLMPFTMVDDNEIVGFFTMRRPDVNSNEIRFGFVIVDSTKRGMGYGKKMLELGIEYAKNNYNPSKISLGVFKNNEQAYRCYKSVGFKEIESIITEKYSILGEEWECLELEISFE